MVQCIDAEEKVAVETMLSSNKYEPTVHNAHNAGYQARMIYLALESAKVSKAVWLHRDLLRLAEIDVSPI